MNLFCHCEYDIIHMNTNTDMHTYKETYTHTKTYICTHIYTLAHIDIICAYRYMDATILHVIFTLQLFLTKKYFSVSKTFAFI